MKTAAWAAVGSLLMGTVVFAQGAAVNDAADDLGRGSAISLVLESGWTFHPATLDQRVIGYLAVLPPGEGSRQAEFNIFWYERGDDSYMTSVWSGWDAHAAASTLETLYGPDLFRSLGPRTSGGDAPEDGRFVHLTPEMKIVDPASEATETLRRGSKSPGAADGPGHAAGNGSDSGDGCGTTTEFVLDRFARRVEMVLFGEARTPASPLLGCCWPGTVPIKQLISVTCATATQTVGGTCDYTSCTEIYTIRICQQRFDCSLFGCTPPGLPLTGPGDDRTSCPSLGPGACAPQPPTSCW